MFARRILFFALSANFLCGSGALGRSVVEHFKKHQYRVINVDLHQNDQADVNIHVDANQSWMEQETHVLKEVASTLHNDKLAAILCVAGGWAGGNAASKDFIKNADLMWKQSVWSSAIAARIASAHLANGGLLQLTGAAPATNGTPNMIGYGMAKAAVHQLVASLADNTDAGLPSNATTIAILPVTLDTPMNRKWMSGADFSKWTPLEFVAQTFLQWTKDAGSRHKSGSLLKFVTENGNTTITAV